MIDNEPKELVGVLRQFVGDVVLHHAVDGNPDHRPLHAEDRDQAQHQPDDQRREQRTHQLDAPNT